MLISPYHPSGSSQCTSPKHPVSCIEPGLATCFMHDIIHVSMPFSQIFPPSPSPTESIIIFKFYVWIYHGDYEKTFYGKTLYWLVCFYLSDAVCISELSYLNCISILLLRTGKGLSEGRVIKENGNYPYGNRTFSGEFWVMCLLFLFCSPDIWIIAF